MRKNKIQNKNNTDGAVKDIREAIIRNIGGTYDLHNTDKNQEINKDKNNLE